MPFAISRTVSIPKSMVPRTLNKPKVSENPEVEDPENKESEKQQPNKKQKLLDLQFQLLSKIQKINFNLIYFLL